MVVRQLIALPSQLQLIDRLQHHIYLSSSLLFVSGEQGAGKSTLLEQLSNKLPDNVQAVFIQLNEQLSDSQIRQQIIVQLYDEPLFDPQDSLFSSIELLQEKQNSDAPRLIIFDNAHYISAQLLAELGEVIAQKQRLGENEINVLLLADEVNSQQMLTSANQRCACLEFKLEALSKNEADSLLNHIFRQAGYQHQIQHQDALAKQLTACAGIPQKIIALAEQIIVGKPASSEPSWLKTRLPALALMLLLLMVAAGLAYYLYPLFIKPSKPVVEVEEVFENATNTTQSVSVDVVPSQLKTEMVEELAGSWKKEVLPDIEESSLKVGISDADVKRVIISEQNILTLAAPEQIDVEQAVNQTENEKTADINEVQVIQEPPQAQAMQQVQGEAEVQEEVEILEVSQLQEVQQLQEVSQVQDEPQILEVQPADPPLEEENSVIENKVVALAPEAALPVTSEKQSLEKEKDLIFTAKSQLLSVPSSYYTLQLSAMAAEESLLQFIAQYGFPKGELHIYQTIRNNKPWYVVIFGEYDSWESAKKASNTLPDSLADLGSWIKRYQLVHQDLRLNNNE